MSELVGPCSNCRWAVQSTQSQVDDEFGLFAGVAESGNQDDEAMPALAELADLLLVRGVLNVDSTVWCTHPNEPISGRLMPKTGNCKIYLNNAYVFKQRIEE